MSLEKSLFVGSPYSFDGFFKFTKGREIGSGSYGNVREAEINDTIYAIKKIRRKVDLNEFINLTDYIRQYGLCYKASDKLSDEENEKLHSISVYELLTCGSFDHVYKAVIRTASENPNFKAVAVRKCLAIKTKIDELQNEHNILKRLEHRNIVSYEKMNVLHNEVWSRRNVAKNACNTSTVRDSR
ncbi:hypothetical protein B4U80_14221 [Leptotrombidium deliense]|uniref:Protein kinase domain-containing protein n=1 Tax=Leptotrombidium deliense TaxID=299467 RepID=A0A443RZY5_9ACAR|nr:hypothetical protein B4U80_14221 [Leptotrombidium deliense]